MNVTKAIAESKKAAAAGLPVMFLGSPGIAKTTIAKILASELGLPYVEIRAAEFESVDFRGICSVVDGKTKWHTPDFWPTEACVLNFDEITQAPMELTSPLLKIFLGGEIGDYKLPAGTILMATGNLVSDRAGCQRLSSALRERCIVINIQPDFSEWLKWFEAQSFYDDSIAGFLKSNPAQFNNWDGKKDFNQPTPRNWERVARLINLNPEEETVAGIIGADVSKSYMSWRRANVSCPSVWDVLEGKKEIPKSPALLSKFVENAATAVNEESDDVVPRIAKMIESLDGTYQLQFLKAVRKGGQSMLKNVHLHQLVKRHAKSINAAAGIK